MRRLLLMGQTIAREQAEVHIRALGWNMEAHLSIIQLMIWSAPE